MEGEAFNISSRVGTLAADDVPSEDETGRPALTGWAFAFVNIRAVCAVVVAALAARKLVDVLQMIRAGFPGIPYYNLPVLVRESDCGCVYAFSRHAPNHTPICPLRAGSLHSFILSLPSCPRNVLPARVQRLLGSECRSDDPSQTRLRCGLRKAKCDTSGC